MTRTLVTSATGMVGSQVVHDLRASGAEVRAFARDRAKAISMLGDVDLAIGDFEDPESIAHALDGVDRVYLSAADGPRKVAHEIAIIDAAAEAGVELIVKLSAMHATPSSELPTYRWHGLIEQYLRRSGVPAVVLRPAFFMSNLLMVAQGVAATGTLYAPTAHQPVAMVDPTDVAMVAAHLLSVSTTAPATYELTGPRAITFDDVADALTTATGRTVGYADLDPEEASPRFKGAGLPDWLGRQLEGVFGLIRQGRFTHANDLIEQLTARPASSIEDFLAVHAVAFSSAADPVANASP